MSATQQDLQRVCNTIQYTVQLNKILTQNPNQGKVKKDQFVVVHGCGGVGLSAIMIAHAKGAKVVAIDIDAETLKFAKNLGAFATINAKESSNLVEEVKLLTQGGAHISLDALGSQETCFNSIACLRKQGKHIPMITPP